MNRFLFWTLNTLAFALAAVRSSINYIDSKDVGMESIVVPEDRKTSLFLFLGIILAFIGSVSLVRRIGYKYSILLMFYGFVLLNFEEIMINVAGNLLVAFGLISLLFRDNLRNEKHAGQIKGYDRIVD